MFSISLIGNTIILVHLRLVFHSHREKTTGVTCALMVERCPKVLALALLSFNALLERQVSWLGGVGAANKKRLGTNNDTAPKFNRSPLKIGNPNRKLIFQPSFFRGYVKFRGCTGYGSPLPKRNDTWEGKDPTCRFGSVSVFWVAEIR